MSENFSGLISSAFKELFVDAINELLRGFATTAKLVYPETKYETCTDCLSDDIGNKSSNRTVKGTPVPHHFAQACPSCGGTQKKPVEVTEEIEIVTIFDSRKFINIGNILNVDGVVQTVSNISMYPKLKKAKEIIFALDNMPYVAGRYIKDDEPLPCGLGDHQYIICYWRRAGS